MCVSLSGFELNLNGATFRVQPGHKNLRELLLVFFQLSDVRHMIINGSPFGVPPTIVGETQIASILPGKEDNVHLPPTVLSVPSFLSADLRARHESLLI